MAYEIFIGDVAFGAALGFLTGIFAAGSGWRGATMAAVLLLGSFISLAWLAMMKALNWPWVGMIAIVAASVVFGACYYHFFVALSSSQTHLPLGKSTSFIAIVSDEPRQASGGDYLLVPANMQKPYAGSVTIFAQAGSDVRYGDELNVAGEIAAPKIAGDSPAVFPKKITLVAAHKGFWLREKMINFKLMILEKLNEVLLPDEAALLGGEMLGGGNNMSADLKNEMAASGTSYVVSMYGYKISLIIFFLEGALKELIARRVRLCVLAAVILLFVAMAGGEASVIRAAIMSSLALIAQGIGRVPDPRNALALTAAGMALFDPTLIAQPAFQLSFLSIIGIKYLAVPFKSALGWERKGAGFVGWREAVVIASASLLPIIPIIANSFSDFSLIAFPSNMLISLGVLPAIIAGVALATIASISYYIAFFIAEFISIVLWYQLAVIKICALLGPLMPLSISFGSPIVFCTYYAALAWFIYFYSEHRNYAAN